MTLTRFLATSALAAGVGAAGLLGLGTGTAAAEPGHPGQPGPIPAQQRGIDQGRRDHQPFMFEGRQVTPMPAGNGAGWGFWFLGRWIGL
ncbi:MAG: hypothetical protein K0R68_3030 [Mycobacterium sp.]|nr:hypothetical protein [Mycobacterium sp.]